MKPTQPRRKALLALASGTTALLVSGSALAFCRTTTCIPGDDCEYDPATGCALSGIPLEWKRPCVSFTVQRDASPLRGITYDRAHEIIEGAYSTWLASSCEGGLPSVDIADLGAVSCNEPQYNQGGPNANVWMFRDAGWDGSGTSGNASETPSGTLAITIITFHPDTGEIYDADVEINSQQVPLTTGDGDVQFDLASIVTHEAGHFLGLSHTRVPDATMRAGYLPGTTTLRHLSPDDQAGMCAIYAPDRELPAGNCTPRHGFSSNCYRGESGCSVSGVAASTRLLPSAWLVLFGAFGSAGVWLRRRSRLTA